MPLEAPTNCWTKNNAKFGEGLIYCPAFQTIVGQATPEKAAARVFGRELDEPLDGNTYSRVELQELRAYAQVYPAIEQPYGFVRTVTHRRIPYGNSVIFLERMVIEPQRLSADADVPGVLDREWENRVGDLMDELDCWLDVNGGPHIRGIAVTDGPGFNPRSEWETRGMWQGVELTVAWGLTEAS